MKAQPGDEPVPVFSFVGPGMHLPNYLLDHHTNPHTHEIIRRLNRSPMYTE